MKKTMTVTLKKAGAIMLLAALLLSLAACGARTPAAQTEQTAPETEAPEAQASAPAAEPDTESDTEPDTEPTGSAEEQIYISFSTESIDGEAVDESIFAGHELVMLNFWEPWCGPCVSELPSLKRLSEEYADKGFLLIGVYSTEDGAADIVSENGLTYPIIKYTDAFDPFQSGYVPNTIFVAGDGRFVAGPYVGAGSYEDWAAVVEALLP